MAYNRAVNDKRAELIPFSLVGRACAERGLEAVATIPLPTELDPAGLDQMLADGIGDMAYLRRNRGVYLNPEELFPEARSILAVTLPYQPDLPDSRLKRARYAAGADYHKLLRRKLAEVAKELLDPDGEPYPSRACVDSAPLMERTLVKKAGLGWIGKNALLITPKRGSYQFLGFLLTAAPLEQMSGTHGADRCGSCNRCHVACPTNALTGRRVLSERCISYLTIEHFGVIPRKLAEKFNGWWFGCDICQEVCPWNRFAPEAGDGRLTGRDSEETLITITAETFDDYFAGRAVRRIGYERFRRNLLVALWSLGRSGEYREIIVEGLPLVSAQAEELEISP